MAVGDILAYLQANEKAVPLDTLILQLRKSGYPENEIQTALKIKNTAAVPAVSESPAKPVWKKILAWLGGFTLAALVFGVAAGGIVFLAVAIAFGGIEEIWIYTALGGAVLLAAGGVFLFIKMRKQKPSFSWGILVATIIFALFTAWAVFMTMSLTGRTLSGTNPRESSRDARRISDIRQMQMALELYYDSNGNQYPENLLELQPKFIPMVPRDPVTQGEYIYEKHADGSYYMGAVLEDPSSYYLQNDVNPGNQIYEVSEAPISSSPVKVPITPPIPSNVPRILILDPNSDTSWKIGVPHIITWRTEGFTARNVNIYLYGLHGKSNESAFIVNNLPNTGKYTWDTKTITLYSGNPMPVSAGQYRIFILSNLDQNDLHTNVDSWSNGWITLGQ